MLNNIVISDVKGNLNARTLWKTQAHLLSNHLNHLHQTIVNCASYWWRGRLMRGAPSLENIIILAADFNFGFVLLGGTRNVSV